MENYYLHRGLACLEGDADPLPPPPVGSVLSVYIYIYRKWFFELFFKVSPRYRKFFLNFFKLLSVASVLSVLYVRNYYPRRKVLFTCRKTMPIPASFFYLRFFFIVQMPIPCTRVFAQDIIVYIGNHCLHLGNYCLDWKLLFTYTPSDDDGFQLRRCFFFILHTERRQRFPA